MIGQLLARLEKLAPSYAGAYVYMTIHQIPIWACPERGEKGYYTCYPPECLIEHRFLLSELTENENGVDNVIAAVEELWKRVVAQVEEKIPNAKKYIAVREPEVNLDPDIEGHAIFSQAISILGTEKDMVWATLGTDEYLKYVYRRPYTGFVSKSEALRKSML